MVLHRITYLKIYNISHKPVHILKITNKYIVIVQIVLVMPALVIITTIYDILRLLAPKLKILKTRHPFMYEKKKKPFILSTIFSELSQNTIRKLEKKLKNEFFQN